MSLAAFLKLLIVALSLGLDVFAVGIGVGMRGVDVATRIRIGIAFTAAEITMTIVGAGIGQAAGQLLGDAAGYLGFSALIGVGIYMIVETLRESEGPPLDFSRGYGLLLGSLSISLDSLGIGFSILYIGVPFIVSLITIGCVCATSTILGLTLGRLLGRRIEETAALWAGVVLLLTGATFMVLKFTGMPE